MRRSRPLSCAVVLATVAFLAVSCGGSPLESLGLRSSEWINEPTVPTTVPVPTTTPTSVPSDALLWANDDVGTAAGLDAETVAQQVFARRQGDRFIQASRFEIAAVLPSVGFPAEAPAGAEWVSSQLVFDSSGVVSTDPSAAFGIWSAEPYSRSRSVAQMMVLKVSQDPDGAAEIESGENPPSCARYADRTAEECEIVSVGDRQTWLLTASSGSTLIWFDGNYRYELFGRSFVPIPILRTMSSDMVPLDSIAVTPS